MAVDWVDLNRDSVDAGDRGYHCRRIFEKMKPDGILFIGGGLGPRKQWDVYFFILTKREAGNVRTDVGRWVTYG